jgi:recombinational DNA repair protein RecT
MVEPGGWATTWKASRMASETSRNRILTEFLNVSMEKNLNNVVETFIGPK